MKKEYMDVWKVSLKDFPFNQNITDQIKFLLKYAVLAPSTHNIQPWLFKIEENICHFLFDPASALPFGDHEKRYATISIGIALENFITVAKACKMNPKVVYTPTEDVYASVSVETGMSVDENFLTLVDAITTRVNVRGVFAQTQVLDEAATALEAVAQGVESTGHLVCDKQSIARIAGLTATGLRRAHNDDNFRKEMASRIVSNISKLPVGIPGYTMNLPLFFSLIVPKIIYWKDISKVLSKLNYKSIASAPIVCVITAKNWERRAWLDVGQVAERLMTVARSYGMYHSVYVAATEFNDIAQNLQGILETTERPAFLFCLGYMNKEYMHSQRMPSEQKILE